MKATDDSTPTLVRGTAMVTGAGSQGSGVGNGRAAAIVLARSGAAVGVVDTDTAQAQATVDHIRAEGNEAIALCADVTSPDQVGAAADKLRAAFGPITTLVNNVGVAGPAGTADDVDLDEWDRAMRINVSSVVICTRAVSSDMRATRSGSIVNMSSVAGIVSGHPTLFYPASKGAIIAMTRAMAAHYGSAGIRVNCVAPGLAYTPMVATRGMTDEMRRIRSGAGLIDVEGTGWDVGQAVTFLASDQARWITGVTLPVDGGFTTGPRSIVTPPRDATAQISTART